MHGLKSGSCRFWHRTDLPPGFNILRAEIQRALRRAPRQLRRLRLGLQTRRGSNHSAAHGSESNSRSNVVQIRRASACVPSRWKVLSGEFRRRPTALARNFANRIASVAEDCLSPERTFHGCSLMHFRGSIPWLIPLFDSVESSIQLWWLIQSIQDFSRGFSNHCIFIFISSNPPHNSSNWIIA